MPSVHIDLVTRAADGATYNLILVEEGPWPDDRAGQQLRRLGERLKAVADAIASGAVADRFPETRGHALAVRLDCYGLSETLVRAICARAPIAVDAYFYPVPSRPPGRAAGWRSWSRTTPVFRVLVAAACAWLILGIVGAAALAGWESDVAANVIIYPAIGIFLLSHVAGGANGASGLLWDSAHGPPFLNAAGVTIVYVIPAVAALAWLVTKRRRFSAER